MRFLFWFLLLAIAAVVAALAARLNAGYALLVAPPYRVELSLNLLLILIVGAFAALYFGLRVIVRTVQLPAQVRAWRRTQKKDRARAKLDAAIVALLEGRYGKAQQQAQEALALPHSSGLAALVAARAAIDVRQFDAAEEFLSRPETQSTSLAVSRLTLSAEIALEQGQPQEALRILEALKREAGMHTAALRLELRATQAARRFADIPALVEQLIKRGVFDATQGEQVRIVAQREQLRALAHDAAGLRDAWNRLPESMRTQPPIARAAALSFLQLGGDREAADLVARSLDREWDSELVELYGECRVPDSTRQIEQAEQWLAMHNHDAVLLRVLGTLCQRQQLWGKAQTYLEASVALDNHWRTHLALGEMLGRLGKKDEANTHFVAALRLATDELKRRSPG
ncbi:MAG TPA: heme biosynthesis HemY N-terminal domain-containing protein [Casimicrobiaceae bacterium]|nr:heme biosynthesis HemY N-terminal domain-containing protein [Casimicrobiaceae bacterium]